MNGGPARILVLTTGGTIEKVYDEFTGELKNVGSNVRRMIDSLKLPGAAVEVREIFSKDSLHITEEERRLILRAVLDAAAQTPPPDGVVIVHGTDTLCDTGALIEHGAPGLRLPVVLTGAWRPFELKESDAMQNLTEALFASRVLPPGVFVVAHGRALRFPGVRKDRAAGTFVKE